MQKLEPLVLRRIERFRVVAKCTVTVDEFPLRAWGTGTILGRPATVLELLLHEEWPRHLRRSESR
jgi:hypothetical protein